MGGRRVSILEERQSSTPTEHNSRADRQMTSSQAVYPLPADINSAAENYKNGDKQAVHGTISRR